MIIQISFPSPEFVWLDSSMIAQNGFGLHIAKLNSITGEEGDAEARDIVHLINRSLLFEISNHISTPSFNSVDSLSEHLPPHPSKF
jgi:hypothetical protein